MGRMFLFLFLLSSFGFLQKISYEESRTYKNQIENELIRKDITSARNLVDSLLPVLPNKEAELEFLILSSIIFAVKQDYTKGIEEALKALDLAEEMNDFISQARLCGILGNQFRLVGMDDKRELYLVKGLEISQSIEDVDFRNKYRGNIYREYAEYSNNIENYQDALKYIKEAIYYQNKFKNENAGLQVLSHSYSIKGRIFLGMKEPERAVEFYEKAKELSMKSGLKEGLFGETINQGLGEAYIRLNQPDSAEFYLKKVEEWVQDQPIQMLVLYNYEALKDLYELKGDFDICGIYEKKIQALKDEMDSAVSNASENVFDIVPIQRQKISKQKSRRFLYWMLPFIAVGVGTGFYVKGRKRALKIKAYKLENSRTGKDAKAILHTAEKRNSDESKEICLSEEVCRDLEQGIRLFEVNKEFLNQDMSFSKMTGVLKTNSKYLNSFLKHNLNTDFTAYINNLRIEYLLKQLKENPEIGEYKITYLAELCGFSSYSAFAQNFKRLTNQSPSEFINGLNNNKNMDN